MKTYVINYYMKDDHHDCGCDGHDHDHHHHHHVDANLIGEIKELGAWAHLMPTTFVVKCEMNACDILDKLKKVINVNDTILVSELNSETSDCTTKELLAWI
ncbi:MAG: hypothetical protein ACRC7N_17300 [Clostridium sp.]